MKLARMRWLALLTVFAMIVAACGADDDSGTETTAAPETTQADTTDTTAGDTTETTEPMDEGGEILTDFGVDLEEGVIRVGMLSDLTGAFGPLVSAILAGYQAYVDDYNANGGLDGLEIELVVRDTGYIVDNHIALYNEIKDDVVMIGHSTGSPHTVAINADLQADDMLTVPLTWYSGWSDSSINAALLSHGTPYCIEAMNTIGYIVDNVAPDAETIAIAGFPADYGQDSARGAKLAAEALGLEVVYDGEAVVIPSAEAAATWTEAANGIAAGSPDIVWLVTNGTIYGSIFSQARDAGFAGGTWSGPSPSWSPALIAPDSDIKDDIAASFTGGTYTLGWVDGNPFIPLFEAGGLPPSDYYTEGVVEAKIAIAALEAAYANGDLTRAGVLSAGKSLENVGFEGVAPSESYAGADNDRIQRAGMIIQPDPDGLASGTSGGLFFIETEYTSEIAANYEFTGACYSLGE
ncbi:MAG: ABC transporter substrate-binding protein, partial [Acidimicrobiia bacterium]|nr:ABC transporter substrate-binding protein [Acidimicrobiia bacterium]